MQRIRKRVNNNSLFKIDLQSEFVFTTKLAFQQKIAKTNFNSHAKQSYVSKTVDNRFMVSM